MGASEFIIKGYGKNAKDAYSDLIEDSVERYGDDPYNGTISTTTGFQDVTDVFQKSKKDVNAFIDSEIEKLSKRKCLAVCIKKPVENTNKIKTQVDHVVEKGTRKWVTKYVVYDDDRIIHMYDMKADAVKKAREFTEKTKTSTIIRLEKHLEKSSSVVARVTYKKSEKEADGTWVFFGLAAE